MKIRLLLMAAMLCFVFGACKKSTQAKKQIKLLTKFTETTDGRTTTTLVTYDSRNRITAIGNRTFTYEGDNLIKITEGDIVKTISYSNGVPVSLRDKGPNWDNTYTYTVVDGRVTKRIAPPFGPASVQFTYAGNNVTVETYSATVGTTYIYGPDKGPYYNSHFKYVFNGNEGELFSENGITEIIYQFSPRLGVTYSYLRDSDGFPKTALRKKNKMNDENAFIYTDITYEYEMRDVAE